MRYIWTLLWPLLGWRICPNGVCVCVCVCVCMYMCVQRGAHTDVRAHTLVCTGTTVRKSLPCSDMCSHPQSLL